MQETTIQPTDDGSPTLFSAQFGETYHSRRGAVTESMHVFIQAGFCHVAPGRQSVRVGEIGFGTGLNAFLTYLKAKDLQVKVAYFAIERFPVEAALIEKYGLATWNTEPTVYNALVSQNNGPVSDFFYCAVTEGEWPVENPFSSLDVLYYDAFAPNTQPEMWNEMALTAAWNCLNPGGILVTYCAKGAVKRTLQQIGFVVEKLPGPPGKREMMRATRPLAT